MEIWASKRESASNDFEVWIAVVSECEHHHYFYLMRHFLSRFGQFIWPTKVLVNVWQSKTIFLSLQPRYIYK